MKLPPKVIHSASREKPADAALREVLKEFRDLPPWGQTAVSKAVFDYYRWHAWLRDERRVETRLKRAEQLAARFRANPKSIPIGELRAKAVPVWAAEQMEVSEDWLRSLQGEPILWLRAKRGCGQALAGELNGAQLAESLLPDAVQ
ncbi:MAG: hypothetical protein MZU97_18615 [Bacillus subtilis]|nr:hypothetical protein [Bacillus subtilis]